MATVHVTTVTDEFQDIRSPEEQIIEDTFKKARDRQSYPGSSEGSISSSLNQNLFFVSSLNFLGWVAPPDPNQSLPIMYAQSDARLRINNSTQREMTFSTYLYDRRGLGWTYSGPLPVTSFNCNVYLSMSISEGVGLMTTFEPLLSFKVGTLTFTSSIFNDGNGEWAFEQTVDYINFNNTMKYRTVDMSTGYFDFSSTDEFNAGNKLTEGQVNEWKQKGLGIIIGGFTMDFGTLDANNQMFLTNLSGEGLMSWQSVFNTFISGTKKMIITN